MFRQITILKETKEAFLLSCNWLRIETVNRISMNYQELKNNIMKAIKVEATSINTIIWKV